MERVERILEKIIVAAKNYSEIKNQYKKTVKVSRKKFEIRFYSYTGIDHIFIDAADGSRLDYEGKKVKVLGDVFEEFLLLFESISIEELKKKYMNDEIKFTKKQMDAVLEKEIERKETFKRNLEKILAKTPNKELAMKVKLGNYGYVFKRKTKFEIDENYNLVPDENHFEFIMDTINFDNKDFAAGEFNHLYYEDLMVSLVNLSEGQIKMGIRKQNISLKYAQKPLKKSFEERFEILLEKRNDLKILEKWFDDRKYQRKIERIDAYIGQLSKI